MEGDDLCFQYIFVVCRAGPRFCGRHKGYTNVRQSREESQMQDNIFYSNNSTKFQNWRFYTGSCELSYWKLNIHLVSYTFLTWINQRNKASIAVLQSEDGHHSTKSVQMHFTAKLLEEGCSGIRQTFSRFLTTGQKVHVGFVLQDTSDWWWKTQGYLLDTGSAAAVHETSVVLKVKLINCSIPTKSVP